MIFLWAFLVGGAICVIGQLMFDVAKLTPAHTMSTLVVAGAIVDGLGWYDPLIKFAGAGATVPITSFGNALVHGAITELQKDGWIGVISREYSTSQAQASLQRSFSPSWPR